MTDARLINSGKTKEIWEIPDEPGNARIRSRNDITAGDGAKHDVVEGKAELSTRTTINVFKLLAACGIPTAYVREESSRNEFVAKRCEMYPYEVVARRLIVPKSSSIEREPCLKPGTRYETLKVEFYLKTTGTVFRGIELPFPKGDPIIAAIEPGGLTVHNAHAPVKGSGVRIPSETLGWLARGGEDDHMDPFGEMERMTRKVFLVLEKAWALQGHSLCDLKIEFGRTTAGELVVADVVDNDSWRVLTPSGEHLDKQVYRDDMPLPTVKGKYVEVASRSERFAELASRRLLIVLWSASVEDDVEPFLKAFKKYGLRDQEWVRFTGSMHKAPLVHLPPLQAELWDPTFDRAVIVYVGRSNGAGPVISGATHVPVITVPNIPSNSTFGHLSVISSLDLPKDMAMNTVIDPANAVLSALSILGLANPRAYSLYRGLKESFWMDESNSPTFGRNI